MKELIAFMKMEDWTVPVSPVQYKGFIEWDGTSFHNYGDTNRMYDFILRRPKYEEGSGMTTFQYLIAGSVGLASSVRYFNDDPDWQVRFPQDGSYDYETVRQYLLVQFGSPGALAT